MTEARNNKQLLDGENQPRDRIVGFETEYGLNCLNEGGKNDDYFQGLIAQKAVKLTPDMYDEDGSRIYVDVGNHPELSTAEETSFLRAGYRMLAGHVKMSRYHKNALERVNRERDKKLRIQLVANTTDNAGNSWGNHSNILAPRSLNESDYVTALAIHNASRIVWSGAGLVVKGTRTGSYLFRLSEKADHIWDVANGDTTRVRALVNLRDEPLADPRRFRRIHDIAGESVFSPQVNALRLASTSIILRACEIGLNFDSLKLDDPVMAIRQISSDPSLKRKVRLANGKMYSGVDVQRKIAETSISAAKAADYLTKQEEYWGEMGCAFG